MRFEVLGPLRVREGERELDLGFPQQRALLGLPVVQAGQPVTAGGIVDVLWPERPPASAVNVVRRYVGALRRLLEPGLPPRAPGKRLPRRPGGYLLEAGEDEVDLLRFRGLAKRGKRAAATGRPEVALRHFVEALSAWRGPVAMGIPPSVREHAVFAEVERELVHTTTMAADAALLCGRTQDVLPRLRQALQLDPLNESLHARLVMALATAGLQAQALDAYESVRRLLTRELGVGPGAELSAAHTRVLRQELRPGGTGADRTRHATELVVPQPLVRAAQLPPGLKVFTGRRTELDTLRNLVTGATSDGTGPGSYGSGATSDDTGAGSDDTGTRSDDTETRRHGTGTTPDRTEGRPDGTGTSPDDTGTRPDHTGPTTPHRTGTPATVLISGMPGIGKSALAVRWAHEVADRFPDGQLYVDLRGSAPSRAPLRPEEALRAMLAALGVAPRRIPADRGALAGLYRSLLPGRRLLLLLDDALDTEQVRPLLPASPGCLTLVTSRNGLSGLVASGARPLRLDLPSAEDARALLAVRVGHRRLAAEPEAVDEIVARCGRLPLALAGVAARAVTRPEFPLAAIATALRAARDSLDAFADPDGAADVRTAFTCSYRRLRPESARLFRLLAPHPGPDLTADAAAALAAVPARTARLVLDELADAHLVTERTPGHYATHDLLRVFAAELGAAHDSPAERHAAGQHLSDHDDTRTKHT
ncbi:BTAD domain-containing putative transcriptional regulator [Streptomyces sp. NPDC087903]|uniref:AfsR/SARP family transcriptional regulator n=1 Tax=Streptomyces sp. NPDC087903 TaxID=3365819 RepID=UPI00382B45E6